jgi:hypothetical protein
MSWAGPQLLAAFPINPELLTASLLLFSALFLGAWGIVWVKRWRKRLNEPEPPPLQTAEDYQALYDQGVMSKEEYERIRTHLAKTPPPGSVPAAGEEAAQQP